MFSYKKLIAFVGALAIVVFGFAKTASATVTVMAEDGWKVSFDGSVNSFYVNTSEDSMKASKYGNALAGQTTGDKDASGITVGLLPAVFAINIHSPTMNGLDMKARLGLYPSTQNSQTKNQGNPASGGQNGSNLDLREIFFAVDGDHGQFLVGRTLSLFLGKNILTDMTLFGVGAVSTGGKGGIGGGTTLGRIGYGYVYPNFNASIRYSTPNMNGFMATVGVYNPSKIVAGGSGVETNKVTAWQPYADAGTATLKAAELNQNAPKGTSYAAGDAPNVAFPDFGGIASVTDGDTDEDDVSKTVSKDISALIANETQSPRFEGELSYASDMDGVGVMAWVNGMFQSADFTDTQKAACKANAEEANTFLTATLSTDCGDVDSWGFGGGLQLSYAGLALTGSGYTGEALGTTVMLDADAIDPVGEEREHWGYIGQITYDFGQGTNFGVSYGESRADETSFDEAIMAYVKDSKNKASADKVTIGVEKQSLLDFMVWHNINSNLRVVAEYGRQESEWFDGTEQEVDIISVGGFLFW